MFLYNTLSRKKEKFQAINPPFVKMYCCGPTVYGLLHVGNFRGAVVYNLLRLWLEHLGYKVEYHYNFTDVDDKIIKKAEQEQVTYQSISKKYIEEFKKDFQALDLKAHEKNPKATEHISEMIQIVQSLIEKDMAYEKDGDVFYRVKACQDYGKLSQRKVKDMRDGVRVDVMESKEDPVDFALWKQASEQEPGWDSPWGKGRPGWHIECTAMIHHGLGPSIDIHGGGMDLVFPHHENELAQSKAHSPGDYVRYWVHHNMFEFDGQKISKSSGSPQTMREFLGDYNGEIFKYLVLSSQYRSPVDFSTHSIHLAIAALSRIYNSLFLAEELCNLEENQESTSDKSHCKDQDFLDQLRLTRSEFQIALNDDLNSPKALSHLFNFVRFFNDSFSKYQFHFKNPSSLSKNSQLKVSVKDTEKARMYLDLFKEHGHVLAMFNKKPQEFLQELDSILLKKSELKLGEIDQLILDRKKARELKDFKKSDEIRDHLQDKGIEIQDMKEDTFWKMSMHSAPDKS